MTPRDPATPDHVPTDRIRVECGPDGLRALDPDRGLVHRVLPADASAIAAGHADAYGDQLRGEVLDAVEQALAAPRWDRRRVLSSSAALAGAGIATVVLPSFAAASSVGGVAFGSGFTGSIEVTPTDLSALTGTYIDGPSNVYARAYGQWVVPAGVTTVQVIATGTSGGLAGLTGTPSPAPYTGAAGAGAQAVGTFSVTEGHTLVVVFSGSQRWGSGFAGGDGGSAAGVGDLGTGSSGDWLIVGGGGGGGAQAGVTSNTPTYDSVAGAYTRDYVGGDGGDAGTGGAAAAGLTGSGTAATSTSTGGGGGTLSAVGSGGVGAINGSSGGTPSGPTNQGSGTALGVGGQSGNNTASGGHGGGGLYGGGAGASTGFRGAAGGGGGGSSYLRTARLAPGTPSEIELLNRAVASGPRVIIYY